MSAGPVLVRIEDDVARITLARAGAGNAVGPATIAGLDAAVDVAAGENVRAVLLDAEGRNFCVGADLHHLAGAADLPAELDAMATGFHAMLARLAALPVPVVAAVQGAAIGGGLGLMMAADVVVAARGIRLGTGYAKLGLSADAGVSYFLTKALGPRLARSLLISARMLDADEAVRLGLVDMLVDDALLASHAQTLASELAKGPSPAFAAIKRLVRAAEDESDFAAHLDRERSEIVALSRMEEANRRIAGMLRR